MPNSHFFVLAVVLVGWLLFRYLREYLFRIEHRPRFWVHSVCALVYRVAVAASRLLRRLDSPEWLVDLPYSLLPLPLCRIGYAMRKGGEL